MKNISVIIPSLDPNERLESVVKSVMGLGFSDIILVDDGSKEENKNFFPKGEGITLLVHPQNKGKGAALKTAITYVIENRPDTIGVVTCDGDGQHLADDLKKVCEKMAESQKFVLGVRDFSLDDVPPKSRIGNRLSSLALMLCCGSYISDTQTGLRAIPKNLLEPMSKIEGDRFEYETNVLLNMKSMGAEYCEVKIETVYLDENKGTHFHPVKDTVRIFSRIIKYLFSSLASFLVDIGLFAILNGICHWGVFSSTALSRAVSSIVNFVLNKKVVFHSGASIGKSLLKYYSLAIPIMIFSAFGVKGLSLLMNLPENSIAITITKFIVDIVLFILNYNVQKKWIFKKK